MPAAVLLALAADRTKESRQPAGREGALARNFIPGAGHNGPVGTEAFEIVRRRLFSSINDQLAAESVCRAFADAHGEQRGISRLRDAEPVLRPRLMHAYPIHGGVRYVSMRDWSSLDNFQRTRGVLKLIAGHPPSVEGQRQRPLIMPGSFPLQDADTRNG